jgi:hypothetical protein
MVSDLNSPVQTAAEVCASYLLHMDIGCTISRPSTVAEREIGGFRNVTDFDDFRNKIKPFLPTRNSSHFQPRIRTHVGHTFNRESEHMSVFHSSNRANLRPVFGYMFVLMIVHALRFSLVTGGHDQSSYICSLALTSARLAPWDDQLIQHELTTYSIVIKVRP